MSDFPRIFIILEIKIQRSRNWGRYNKVITVELEIIRNMEENINIKRDKGYYFVALQGINVSQKARE